MIAIEMSGDFSFTEFASNRRELSRMIETARAWLFKQGYREFRKSRETGETGETIIASSRNGGHVVITTSSTRPAGVR